MQMVIDRERKEAEIAIAKRIALRLWKSDYSLDKIVQITELSTEQVKESIQET